MRFVSLTLLVAFGIAGTAACGSGGAGGGGSGPPLHHGPYETPPSDYDTPALPNPTDYDTPQSGYDPPPGQADASGTNGAGAVGQWCLSFCHDLLACPQIQA